jgi:hypothetical protein
MYLDQKISFYEVARVNWEILENVLSALLFRKEILEYSKNVIMLKKEFLFIPYKYTNSNYF